MVEIVNGLYLVRYGNLTFKIFFRNNRWNICCWCCNLVGGITFGDLETMEMFQTENNRTDGKTGFRAYTIAPTECLVLFIPATISLGCYCIVRYQQTIDYDPQFG